MTNQFNDPKKVLSPCEKWDEWRKTVYSNATIRFATSPGESYLSSDRPNEDRACVLFIQAVIAYKVMVETHAAGGLQ